MYLRYIIFDAWNMGKINILSLCIFDTVIIRVKYLIETRKRQLFGKRTLQMVEEREEQRLDHRQPWDRSIHQKGLQLFCSGMLHKLRRLRQGDSLPIAWWWRTTKEMDHLSEQNQKWSWIIEKYNGMLQALRRESPAQNSNTRSDELKKPSIYLQLPLWKR